MPTKTVTELGAGVKNAYQGPFAIFTVGDSLYVSDWALRRVTVWTLDGHFAGAVPTPDNTRGTLPTARDGAGNWYVQLNPVAGPDGERPARFRAGPPPDARTAPAPTRC